MASDPTWTTSPARRAIPVRRPMPPGRGRGAGGAPTPQGPAPANAAPAGEGGGGLSVRGLPLAKPPYARITAIDLNKGEILWSVAHGETPDNIKNHPALKGLNIPRTGRP